MIVRTYGRRNRGITRTCSDTLNDADTDLYDDSPSLSQEAPQDIYNFNFSSQDSSSLWSSFDSEPLNPNSSQNPFPILPSKSSLDDDSQNGGLIRKSKKLRFGKRDQELAKNPNLNSKSVLSVTATLLETQEFGEMMEHMDEVNFALDGLRKGQPVRIRRASLVSLLSICNTAHQRRLLRSRGIAKTVVDAILGLSFDDSLSNLAATALFYALTSDGQDDQLLESAGCIRFLIKILKPIISTTTEDKAPKIGRKLLALHKDADILQDTTVRSESSSAAIVSKVQEILVSCKQMKSSCGDYNGIERPELSPKWIALLTMEKACLSTISLEDTSSTIRKHGGNFKEKLRELEGLDTVFELAMNCHSEMEGWIEHGSLSLRNAKDYMGMQNLMLLLKCLKIMENATFLSKDNQNHLLGMKRNMESQGSPLSFIELIISVIKILSGLYALKNSSATSYDRKSNNPSDGNNLTGDASELALIADDKVNSNETSTRSYSKKSCSTERNSTKKSFNVSQNSQGFSTARLGYSVSSFETTTTSMSDSSFKLRVNSSASGSCSGTKISNSETHVANNGSRKKFGFGKDNDVEDLKFEFLEDSQDPFAFDESDFEPSKWDLLSGRQVKGRTRKSRRMRRQLGDGCQSQDSQLMMSQQESSNRENCIQESSNGRNCLQESSNGKIPHYEISCSGADDTETFSLLADCLLTAVKVLMNLTNDHPVGCLQVAACGGLETMSSLIAGHFPSFSSSSSFYGETEENTLSIELDRQSDRHLTDQELDFLVAILGLLVNLVEKNGGNRSRLAAASVSLPSSELLEDESRQDVIPLLCSIFLANQGAGEAAEEGRTESWNDEEAVLEGEKEAEKMIVEAYAALLLAFLSTESKGTRDAIADRLPGHSLAILVPVLDRFLAFHLTLNMITPETHKTVSEVIESCRIR